MTQDWERSPSRDDTAALRAARIEREAEIVAQGRAQLDAGQGIPLEALKTWLQQRRTDPSTPLPVSSGGPARKR